MNCSFTGIIEFIDYLTSGIDSFYEQPSVSFIFKLNLSISL